MRNRRATIPMTLHQNANQVNAPVLRTPPPQQPVATKPPRFDMFQNLQNTKSCGSCGR